MADATATTPVRATEVLHMDAFATPIMSAFADLLDALSRHAVAERDIEDVDIWDVGFRHWLTEAEEVFTELTTLLSRIRRADVGRAEDLALQRVADVIDAMTGSEEPRTFQRLHAWLPASLSTAPARARRRGRCGGCWDRRASGSMPWRICRPMPHCRRRTRPIGPGCRWPSDRQSRSAAGPRR